MYVSALLISIVLSLQTANEWYAAGVRLAAAGKPAEAIDAYRQAVAGNPKYAEAWNNLGDLLRRAGDRDGALDAINHALAADPDHARAALNAALLQIEAKHFSEALGFIEKARKGMGDQPALDYLAARVYLELNDYTSAHPYVERFHRGASSSPAASLELATLLMDREQHAAAVEVLLSVSEDKRTGEMQIQLGQAWFALDRLETARSAFTDFLKLAPNDFRGHLWRGYAERGLGDAETADRHWRQALALNPVCIDALVALADLELDRNRTTESLALSQSALELDREAPAALLIRGLALLRGERPSDAAAALSSIRSTAAEYARALYPLSRAYRQTGQMDKADAALREFQALDEADRSMANTPGRKRPQ